MRKKLFVLLLVGLFVLSSTSLVYAFMSGGGSPSGPSGGGSPSGPSGGGSPDMPSGPPDGGGPSGPSGGGSPGMPSGPGMPDMPGGFSGNPPAGQGTPGQGLYPGGFTNPPPSGAVFLDIPPAGVGGIQSLFGPEAPPRMEGGQMIYQGSGSYPGGFSNPPPDNPEFLNIPPISPSTPPPGGAGVFGGGSDFFNGGLVGMFEAPKGAVFEITPPPPNAGWVQEEDGKWKPPSDWVPNEGWKAPEGWTPGQAITLEEAPWNYLAAKGGKGSEGSYIPGTLVKLPENMTLAGAMTNFDTKSLGINLPSSLSSSTFQKMLMGEAVADTMMQDNIKALNPGKFGPMSDPYIMSRASGLAMDGGGSFRTHEQKDAPGNQFILKADDLAREGKFAEALNMMNDPAAPFGQFPDALIYAFKADLSAKANMMNGAMDNIEKALALAPFNEVLYEKTGQMLKETGKTENPNVYINGVKPGFDVEPFIDSGRTMVPFRALAETMGADVQYDGAMRQVTMTKGDKKVVMTIDSNKAMVNGREKELDVPAQIVNSRTVIPLRFVGENLEAKVDYFSGSKLVKIMPVTE